MEQLNGLALSAGICGLELGIRLALGTERYRTVCLAEWESYAASVIVARMAETSLDKAPVWDNVKTFDGKPWCGVVDFLSAGYPCQPFSKAGKRRGTEDPRHLFPHIKRIIKEVEPKYCFFENVGAHLGLGFREVKSQLENLHYRVEAGLFSAEQVGATHIRERLFIMAVAEGRQINLSGMTLNWRSPMAKEPQISTEKLKGEMGTRMFNKETGREVQTALSTEVRHWKTPQGTDGEGGVMEIRSDADGHYKLRDYATNWATVRATEGNGSQYQVNQRGDKNLTVTGQAKNWNTPTARANKMSSQTQIATGDTRGRLENQNLIFQSSHPDPTIMPDGKLSFLDHLSSLPPSQKRLNPSFCEWLMGLPVGWTSHDTKINLPAWEMQFHLLLRHLLSAYWQSGLE